MKPVNGYAEAKPYTEQEKIPAGAYIVSIFDAEEVEYDWGRVLVLKFDVAEGDYKNYYSEQYKNAQYEDARYKGAYRMNIPKGDGSERDGWTLRRFKTDIAAIEESNSGFHWDWDESELKGKTVGMVLQEKEWAFEGKTGMTALPHSLRPIDAVRSGKIKIPAPKLLDRAAAATPNSYVPIDDGDLPF